MKHKDLYLRAKVFEYRFNDFRAFLEYLFIQRLLSPVIQVLQCKYSFGGNIKILIFCPLFYILILFSYKIVIFYLLDSCRNFYKSHKGLNCHWFLKHWNLRVIFIFSLMSLNANYSFYSILTNEYNQRDNQ